MTITAAVEVFMIDQRLRGNTDKTVSVYRSFLRRFAVWIEENYGIGDVSNLAVAMVNEYQLHLREKKCERGHNDSLTNRTIQTYMRHVKVFLAFCHKQGILADDLAGKMVKMKAEKPIIEILTQPEIERILARFGSTELDIRNRAIVLLLLDCGLRLAEVSRIQRDDVNFDNGYIKVMGKGRKGRIVPMGEMVSKNVCGYLVSRRGMKNEEDERYVFATKYRTPITENTVAALMKDLKRSAGVKRIHAHIFRHTFATNYLVYGLGDVYELSRLMGHADIRITEKYVTLASYYLIMQRRERKTYMDTIWK